MALQRSVCGVCFFWMKVILKCADMGRCEIPSKITSSDALAHRITTLLVLSLLKNNSGEILKREDMMNYCPNYRTPSLFSSNQGKELETRNLLTLLVNISLALTVGKIRCELRMERILNKTVPLPSGRRCKGRTHVHWGFRGRSCVSERSTEPPKFPGRTDHVGSARSGRRWLLSWFLRNGYDVGRSRWREECSKKKERLVFPTLAWESFQDSSGVSPDTVYCAELCLSQEKAAATALPFNPSHPHEGPCLFSLHEMVVIGSCAPLPCAAGSTVVGFCNQSLNHIDASRPFCLLGTPCF